MPISAECGTAKDGSKRHYYKCLGRKRNNGCTKSSVRKELFEEFVIYAIIFDLKGNLNKEVKELYITFKQ